MHIKLDIPRPTHLFSLCMQSGLVGSNSVVGCIMSYYYLPIERANRNKLSFLYK